MRDCVSSLSDHLFWDVDKSKVDAEKNARWILERVLERGFWEDWIAVRDYYGKERMKKHYPALRLDAKSANFLKLYLE
jgi:hypothetical protein